MEEAEGEVTVDMVKAKVKQLGNRVEAAEVEEEETGEEDVEAEGAGVGAEAEASSTVGEGTTAIPGRVHSKPNYTSSTTTVVHLVVKSGKPQQNQLWLSNSLVM